MPVNKVNYGNQTIIDLTDSTLSDASQLVSGITAYDRSGTKITGTYEGSEWTSGIYMDEDGYIHVSPLAGAGGVVFEDGYLVFSPNAGDATIVTTPTYMWKDTNDLVHFSTTEHSGYRINVASVEEHHTWATIWEATISEWSQENNCYTITADIQLNLQEGIEYKVTYDGTVYMTTCSSIATIGSNVYGWDGISELEYPFGITDGGDHAYVDVTTGGTHTFKVEREE